MRLDIPREQPRRREGNDAAPGSSDGSSAVRKPPDNPILHRLKSLEARRPTANVPSNHGMSRASAAVLCLPPILGVRLGPPRTSSA